MESNKKVCPLLKDPSKYNPDTVDLINDLNERSFWFKCLLEMVKNFIKRAGILNPDNPEAKQIAEKCFHSFKSLIDQLHHDPTILNPLSIRTLLEFNERKLRENNFKDAWLHQKHKENEMAFTQFPHRIKQIDNILDESLKWEQIAKGVLAGNMFDWGAKAVTDILEESKEFGLQQAMDTIQSRPWFKDTLDKWVFKIQTTPYKMTIIFVDNAGVDFVLGILPFARELLKQKTKVVLSSNSSPALNDITHIELKQCLEKASKHCQIIRDALNNELLIAMENGQDGPCLDLTKLDEDLCQLCNEADLVILEGMGRAVHTNLYAEFKVDSLKMAVLKNEWLAKSLGAEQFSVIFEYVPVS